MELYFIRHGETEYNKLGISQGHLPNIFLNEKGMRQSKLTGNYLKNYRITDKNFDIIYCSPLDRAKHTCDIISKILNIKNIVYDDRLKELDMGLFSGKLKTIKYKALDILKNEYKNKYNNDPIELKKNINELEEMFFDKYKMETTQASKKRGLSFMKDIVKSNHKKILIISHGKIMNNTFQGLFNTSQKFEDDMLETTNCFICYMLYNDNKYKMIMPPNNTHLKIE